MSLRADIPGYLISRSSLLLIAASLAAAMPVYGQPVNSAEPVSAAQTDAQGRAIPGGGWGLRLGYQEDYRNIALVYQTPTWWSHQFQNGWGRIDLNAELGVSYWDARRGDPDSLWQLSATPMLRWWPNEFFYTEIGVGATVLNRTSFADRHLGSAFQFGDHIGFGTIINRSHQIGVRYSHFSNAGIKEPNDGLDVIQLTYTYRY
jgi:lipid A 3-O-deacylase